MHNAMARMIPARKGPTQVGSLNDGGRVAMVQRSHFLTARCGALIAAF